MALCTTYSSVIVEDTSYTIQYGLNGTYLPTGTNTVDGATYTVFIKEGAVSYPKLSEDLDFIEGLIWRIDGALPYPGFNFGTSGLIVFSNCPVGVWNAENIIITGVPAAPSQNTFGLSADVVALITSRFGSVANFLRLRNQGQV